MEVLQLLMLSGRRWSLSKEDIAPSCLPFESIDATVKWKTNGALLLYMCKLTFIEPSRPYCVASGRVCRQSAAAAAVDGLCMIVGARTHTCLCEGETITIVAAAGDIQNLPLCSPAGRECSVRLIACARATTAIKGEREIVGRLWLPFSPPLPDRVDGGIPADTIFFQILLL